MLFGGADVFRTRDGVRDGVEGGVGYDCARVDHLLDRLVDIELVF